MARTIFRHGHRPLAAAWVAPVAQVKKFALLQKEPGHEDDELTATQNIRRK